MASEHVWPVLAVIDAEFGDAIEIAHDPASREIRIGLIHRGEEEAAAWISASARDELRELLDRAAMPGQDAPGTGGRMAMDAAGSLKPLGEFAGGDKWWCECEAAAGPHVHCMTHLHLVDITTGMPAYAGRRDGRGEADGGA